MPAVFQYNSPAQSWKEWMQQDYAWKGRLPFHWCIQPAIRPESIWKGGEVSWVPQKGVKRNYNPRIRRYDSASFRLTDLMARGWLHLPQIMVSTSEYLSSIEGSGGMTRSVSFLKTDKHKFHHTPYDTYMHAFKWGKSASLPWSLMSSSSSNAVSISWRKRWKTSGYLRIL